MNELVRYEVAGPVATITLDSPANRNALSRKLRTELIQALETAGGAADVRVIVLSHTGRVFCAGMDLKETVVAGSAEQGVRDLPRILQLITRCPKPVIARVAGAARAGGVGILAAADIAVAVRTATFAFSEVRIGVIPAVISVPVLHRVTAVAARELFLTGDIFDALRAKEIGLINAVEGLGDDDDVVALDAAVDGFVTSVLKGAPLALAGTKELLNAGRDDSDERYEALLSESASRFASAEGIEGAAAFAEKRSPSWVTA